MKSFYLAETDLTANTPGTMVQDQNGNVCALIKVETTADGFSFDVGSLGVTETKRVGGEIWVYVPFGIRKITLSHPQLGIIRDYALPCAIEKGRTYILKLNTPLESKIYDSSKEQKMILHVSPAQAEVRINGVHVNLDRGIHEGNYPLGTYDMTVSYDNYHTLRRKVEISDPDNPHNIRVALKPMFGWLTISGEGDETIYIDGETSNYIVNTKYTINSGNYQLKINKPYHSPYETTFVMRDSLELKLNPTFTPIYRDLELLVDNDAEIWVNGLKVANGSFKNKFLYGTYQIECRKNRHTQTSMILEVTANTTGPIKLSSPVPDFKEMEIMADGESEIWIDNNLVGKGSRKYTFDYGKTYEIECRKTGHRPTKLSLPVTANTQGPVHLAAPEPIYGSINVTSNVQGAELYIDNEYVGTTPYSNKILIGQHKISLRKEDYPSEVESVYIEESQNETINFILTREIPYFVKTNVTADVTFDGDYKGVTPHYGRATMGKHNLTLKSSGYKTLRSRIDLSKPYQEFYYTLQPKEEKTKSYSSNVQKTKSYSSNKPSFMDELWEEKRVKFGVEAFTGYDNAELEAFFYGVGLNWRYGSFQLAPKLAFGYDSYFEEMCCMFSIPIAWNINLLPKDMYDWSPYVGVGYSPTFAFDYLFNNGLVQAGVDFRHWNFNCGLTVDLEDIEYWTFTFGVTYYL